MSFIILLFCEIIPITLGVLHSRKLAYKLAFIAKPLLYILKPIVFLFRILTESLIKRINLPAYPHKEDICLEEISQAVDVMVEEGTIKEYEERLIDKLISLKNINIKDIMTPINKLQKINLNEPTINIQIKEIINQGKFSRIPVFKDHRIIGILHIKSLINYLDNPNKFRLEKYLKKPYFVKEDENIAKLLVDLKQKKKHLAVVGSPFEVKGIVTMQDILSQIFGKIKEE
jgi:putative hemolysin